MAVIPHPISPLMDRLAKLRVTPIVGEMLDKYDLESVSHEQWLSALECILRSIYVQGFSDGYEPRSAEELEQGAESFLVRHITHPLRPPQ